MEEDKSGNQKRKPIQLQKEIYLLNVERAILLERLVVLERELDKIYCLLGSVVGKIFVQWWLENKRQPVIDQILELNRKLGINVPSVYRKVV